MKNTIYSLLDAQMNGKQDEIFVMDDSRRMVGRLRLSAPPQRFYVYTD